MTLVSSSPSKSPYAQDRRRSGQRQPRAPEAATRVTALVSSARPYETILLVERYGDICSTVTALVDRRTGALAVACRAEGLDERERAELEGLARGPATAPPLSEVPLSVARARLRRALLATRIAGGAVPEWLAPHADLRADLAPTSGSTMGDVYTCIACDAALPVHEQLARAERRGLADGPPRCPHCRGDSHASDSEGEAWLGRAWLMIAAGLPQRALACAARAEAALLDGDRVHAVRGAAYLALGERITATSFLTRALEHEPEGERADRLRGWLAA